MVRDGGNYMFWGDQLPTSEKRLFAAWKLSAKTYRFIQEGESWNFFNLDRKSAHGWERFGENVPMLGGYQKVAAT